MLLESDLLIAHLKTKDKLKDIADKLLLKIAKGELTVIVNREIIHEIYYVLRNLNFSIQDILIKIGALKSIPNIEWIPTTIDTDLLAMALMSQYGIASIFDAYNIATCLLYDKDRTIISTNHIYDRINSIKRIDPRDLI
ncbi:VapC toxin family PIN domain ribonuclease [Sulfolobus tengchongensis]|uniref:VapC toxin family PIN domain ribonuclease n=1 Tax=Sulfolobus tengchongensis TaxID=207809 RepID=A0AAX4L0I7_9CREN